LFDTYNNSCQHPDMDLKDRVKAAREHADLKQVELVARVRELSGRSFTQQALSKLETGESSASEALAAIAVACGVNAEWLVTGEGEMVLSSATEDQASPQSQPVGLVSDTLSETAKALLERDPKRDWFSFIVEQPDLFIQAYRLYADRTSDVISERQLGIKLADLVPIRTMDETGDEREKKVSASGTPRRSMGKSRKRKA
jgi:transcriptional regulator with XRE-family HTH domain